MPEKPLDTISRVTGLTQQSIKQIWEDAKVNKAKLDGCALHDFSIVSRKTGEMPREYRCSRCGGTVDAGHKIWYEKGLAHGKNTLSPGNKS